MAVEKGEEIAGEAGQVNQVDTSEERLEREWGELDAELGESGQAASGDESAEEAGAAPSSLAPLLSMVFSLGVNLLAPAWALTKAEIDRLAGAWSPVIVKWIPAAWLQPFQGGGGVCVECTAIGTTVEIFVPRLGRPRFEGQAEQQAAPAGGGRQADPGEFTPVDAPESGFMKDIHGQA